MFKDAKNQTIQDIQNNIKQIRYNKAKNNKPNKTLDSIITLIFHKFRRKYNHMQEIYDYSIIDNIIYNDKSHIVSVFKDLLIINDYSEYLKRFYGREETLSRLEKYCEYYNLYSKIFPNYTSIPEGQYFYLNIQKKQRMIDLQEKMENERIKKENQKNKNIEETKQETKVFSTSMVNSTLNRINKEEMELLFDINYDNIKKDDIIFEDNINKLIDLMKLYEVKKENFVIEYNYENERKKNKNKNKNNKAENKSPLMNININYINYNKLNDDKSQNFSNKKKQNKSNIFLYRKINKMPMKDNKNNNISIKKETSKNKITSLGKKDYNLFMMKFNQIKKNKKILKNMSNYIKNKYLSNKRNNSFIYNKSYNSKLTSKSGTIGHESRNKSSNTNSNIIKNSKNMTKIFSCKSSFVAMQQSFNVIDFQKISFISPFTSRNKNIRINNDNNMTNIKCFSTGRKMTNSRKEHKPIFNQKNANIFKFNNNSRNKVLLSKFLSNSNRNTSQKFSVVHNSKSPPNSKFSLRQKKKMKKDNSFLNKTVFNKNIRINNYAEKINDKSNYIEKMIFNCLNENINKNNSFLPKNNNCDSFKSNRLQHSHSTKGKKKRDSRNVNNIGKKNIKAAFISQFLKAFNNPIKTNFRNPFTQRGYKK